MPTPEALEARLRKRGSDGEEVIRWRLERAREECREKVIGMYQYVIVNDVLERAEAQLRHVIGSRRVERERILPALTAFDFG